MAVKKIVFDLHPTLIGPYTSLTGVFQGPLWYYLLGIPIIVLGGDPWGAVVLMLVVSIAVCLVAFFWMRRLFGIQAGLITFMLFAVSPEAIAAATFSWNPHPMWLLILLYALLLYEIVNGKTKLHLVLWPLIALMFHFEIALASVLFISTIVVFVLFYRTSLKNNKFFIWGILLSLFFFLPQILFDIRHNFLMTKSALAIFSGKDQGLFVTGESRHYLDSILRNTDVFIVHFRSAFPHNGFLHHFPLFICIATIFSFFFMRMKILSKKEKLFIFCLLQVIITTMLFYVFFYPFPLRAWFLTGFQVFYILIVGLVVSKLWLFKLGKVLLIFFSVVLFIHALLKIHTLYISPPDDGGLAKIKGKRAAIDYIYHDAKGKEFGLLIFTPPVYTDAYDYLIWWHGKSKYHYIPHTDKKGIFYLLVEPDPHQPWSYKGWMETVVKTGKIINTIQLPSGFIIQKRSEQ